MGYYKKKIIKVSKGQISSQLIERTEIGILDSSCQQLTNWQNSKYGAIKSQIATTLRYTFGANKKVKLARVRLNDNTEGFFAFNATDQTLSLFNQTGELISNIYSFTQLTENNYKNLQIAQNQDLILLCLGDNPLIRIHIDNLPNISAAVFSIPASSILKASNISVPAVDPVLYRMGNEGLPTFPKTLGVQIGDYVYPNSGTADPNTTFPWNVQRLVSAEDVTTYKITQATINTEGQHYQVGDIVTTSNGDSFEIDTLGVGEELTILIPEKKYTVDPAGTNIPVTGGSGEGMTIDIVSQDVTTIWQSATYTPAELDDIIDVWDSDIWEYVSGSWIDPELTAVDRKYATTWKANASSGTIKVKGTGTLCTITAPAGIDAEKYARSIVIGVEFDGLDAIGIMLITDIAGTASGQDFNITSFTGQTIINFDQKVDTDDQTGFLLKLSQVKVFDGDYPSTDNNPSLTTNYPTRILFYQQRLIIAGTRYNRSQMIFSRIGVYDDFVDENLDSSAFQLVIGSTEKEQIMSVLINNGIQIFTSNSEWLMQEQTITRTSGFIRNSQIGTNGVQPIIAANGVTLFPPKNGKGIIGFTYSYESATFMTPYITLFTNLLDNPIEDLMLKRGLDSQDDTLIYICDSEGRMVVGNYLQEHDIQAFCLRDTENVDFKQVIQCEQNVLFLSVRNGYTSIEKTDDTKKTALSVPVIYYNYATGIVTIPYPQYNGLDVNVYDGNGNLVGVYTVTNSTITIPAKEKPLSISEIGYNIHSTYESNPINIGNETKTLFKTLNSVKIAVTPESKTEFLTCNGKYGRREGDLVIYIRPTRPLKDCRFTIENDNYPVEILSMELEIEA